MTHPQPLSIEQAMVLAARIDEAVQQLRDLGFTVLPSSRFPEAAKLLRRIADAECFPRSDTERVRVTNAINGGMCLVRTVDSLNKGLPTELHEPIRHLLSGSIESLRPSRAHQAQSELFFGVAVLLGGMQVAAPRRTATKTPDFVAVLDSLRFSIEVKRPSSSRRLHKSISEAAKQIVEYGNNPGVIALDLTDLLDSSFTAVTEDPTRALLNDEFAAIFSSASRFIEDRQHSTNHFGRIAASIAYCYPVIWDDRGATPGPLLGLHMQATSYHSACHGLIPERSQKFRDKVIQGFQRMGGGAWHMVQLSAPHGLTAS